VVLERVKPGCPCVRKHCNSANRQGTQKEATAKGDLADLYPPGDRQPRLPGAAASPVSRVHLSNTFNPGWTSASLM
jgi:hypothetical protein